MTLRLTIDRARWSAHIERTAAEIPGLVPVVKGNGYGFGRAHLHTVAATLSEFVCVGNIHELDHVVHGVRPVVLTPATAVPAELDDETVLTVGSVDDVAALGGWSGHVIVKLRSSMQRFGATPDELSAVLAALDRGGQRILAYGLHLPLAGSDEDRISEVNAWLDDIPEDAELWLSHLEPPAWELLTTAHPTLTFRQRIGTRLWHGTKEFLHLQANVLAVHPVRSGDRVGYRASEVPADGHLVVIGAGSAAGIATNDGLSPFHFARTRLALLEAPHMHVSLVHVPAGSPCPQRGEWIDVQRPLTAVKTEETIWS